MITYIIPNKQGNASTLGKLFTKLGINNPQEEADTLIKELGSAINLDHIQGYTDPNEVIHYIFTFTGNLSRIEMEIYIQNFLSELNQFFDWEGTTTITYIQGNTFIGTLNI